MEEGYDTATERRGDAASGGAAEFAPGETEAALESFDRRTFLKLMGASLAMAGSAGLGACTKPQPLEKIVPRASSPERELPGVPQFYASALPTGGGSGGGTGGGWVAGFGRGVVVEQHEGRPTKIEGNPDHPSSLGAADIFMQAAVLQLYDPDRSKGCLRVANGQPISWGGVLSELLQCMAARGGAEDLRVRLLTGTMTSPTIIAQIGALRNIFPKLVWHTHDVVSPEAAREGQRRALGRTVTPVYDFSKATRIVSLDAHFLAEEPGALRYAREFAHRRRVAFQEFGPNHTHIAAAAAEHARLDAQSMSRLYVAESSVTFTGAMADHRLAIRPGMMAAVARALASAVSGVAAENAGALPRAAAAWVAAAAADLQAHGGGGGSL